MTRAVVPRPLLGTGCGSASAQFVLRARRCHTIIGVVGSDPGTSATDPRRGTDGIAGRRPEAYANDSIRLHRCGRPYLDGDVSQ